MNRPVASGARVRVLIADDHRLFAESLMTSLCADDRIDVVGLAHTGRQAVDLTEELQPDIVLMDLNMPDMDGFEATRIIHEEHPSSRVLVLTGSDSPADAARARAAGAAGFVTKDRSTAELMEWFFELALLSVALGGIDRTH
jgi:DNA-binding NarL/FixJ family response regulator